MSKTGLKPLNFKAQTIDKFMESEFPPKHALIQGVLFERDLISLTGRRRHGKTLLGSNLALAGAAGLPEYLGFEISNPFSSVVFYLEDDSGDMQGKIAQMQTVVKPDPKFF